MIRPPRAAFFRVMEPTKEEQAPGEVDLTGDEPPDSEAVRKALARVESDAITTAHLRARASAHNLLETMPDWWKEKFRVAAKTHFQSRKGRRVTAKLLRDYATWQRRTETLRARQAVEKKARNLRLSQVLFARDVLGLPPPRCVSREAIDRLEEARAADAGS